MIYIWDKEKCAFMKNFIRGETTIKINNHLWLCKLYSDKVIHPIGYHIFVLVFFQILIDN